MYGQMVASPPNGAGLDITNATEAILQRMTRTDNNEEFLQRLTDDQ
jgi:hypothetical protein